MENFRQLFNFCLLLFCTAQRAVAVLSGPGVACLDTADDLQDGFWIPDGGFSGMPMIYAENSAYLPTPVQGLDGRGIFYNIGDTATAGGLLRFSESPANVPSPAYMYVKYYGHVVSSPVKQRMSVFPALHGNDGGRYNLASTSGFKWAEQLVQIDLDSVNSRINVHEQFFTESDIFLLDQVILSYGQPINNVSDILRLCPLGEVGTTALPPATDDPTTEATVVTTPEVPTSPTPPPVSGPCSEPGYAPDPKDCSKFHQCRYDDDGKLIDEVFTCPEGTVWCQEELRCEFSHICPCDL